MMRALQSIISKYFKNAMRSHYEFANKFLVFYGIRCSKMRNTAALQPHY